GGIKVHGHPSGPYAVTGTRINDNTVRMPSDPTNATAICIEVWGGSPHSTIVGNTTFGGSMGISNGGADYSTITGNTIHEPKSIGIECAVFAYGTVTGNTIY